jgi:hypothetical protein
VVSTEPVINSPGGNTSPGARLRLALPELALAAWTLFVWVGRIRNILADDTLEGYGRVWRLGMAGGLSALAVAVLAAILIRPITAGPVRALAASLAGVSSAIWIVRGLDIAVGAHELGFKVIHTILAVVTVALSVVVARHLRATAR